MSIIIRVVVIATCAYAGSVVAGIQFPDLPVPHEMRKNIMSSSKGNAGEHLVMAELLMQDFDAYWASQFP